MSEAATPMASDNGDSTAAGEGRLGEIDRLGRAIADAHETGLITDDQWRAFGTLLDAVAIVRELDPRVKARGMAPAAYGFFGIVSDFNKLGKNQREAGRSIESLLAALRAESEARRKAEGEVAILKRWVGLLAADPGGKDPAVFVARVNGCGPVVGVYTVTTSSANRAVEPLPVEVPKPTADESPAPAKEAP